MNKTIENDSVHENPAQKELALSLDLNKREAGITADEKNVFDNTSEIISTVDEAKKENRRIVGLLICICLFSICGGNLFYTITPFLEDLGYTSKFAALFTSIVMIVLTFSIGKFLNKKNAD